MVPIRRTTTWQLWYSLVGIFFRCFKINMSRAKRFTKDEIDVLSKSPYVKNIRENRLSFTCLLKTSKWLIGLDFMPEESLLNLLRLFKNLKRILIPLVFRGTQNKSTKLLVLIRLYVLDVILSWEFGNSIIIYIHQTKYIFNFFNPNFIRLFYDAYFLYKRSLRSLFISYSHSKWFFYLYHLSFIY